jgi:predicted TIM-barrel fold metal-dependent hydrolase
MATEYRTKTRLADFLIVDADVHLHESPEGLAPYCDLPWRKSLETLTGVPERYLDLPGFSPGTGYDPPFPGGAPLRFVRTAAQMREELDAIGIDLAVLFPDHLLKLAVLPHADYAAAVARAYNRWMIAEWLAEENGLYGALCVAPQDPASSAKDIAELGSHPRIACAYLPAAGLEPLYGHRCYDPIFEAAQDAGLPVAIHSVAVVHPVFPFQLHQYHTTFARHTIAHPFAMMANMTDMISTGVPVRFPRLKIAFMEAGISWVPFMAMRMDKEYQERRREVPFLTEPPSHYIRGFYYGTQPIEEPENPEDLVAVMRLYGGEDNTLFASDWPHHDFDHPREALKLPLAPEAKRKIMGENARRFFRFERG